ncbi:hypothetical protein BC629DRAFT_1441893 [Irpex lacteus]|nr:hypothetical protein BC629DRAFT_1441893 [Irpex lacteus]
MFDASSLAASLGVRGTGVDVFSLCRRHASSINMDPHFLSYGCVTNELWTVGRNGLTRSLKGLYTAGAQIYYGLPPSYIGVATATPDCITMTRDEYERSAFKERVNPVPGMLAKRHSQFFKLSTVTFPPLGELTPFYDTVAQSRDQTDWDGGLRRASLLGRRTSQLESAAAVTDYGAIVRSRGYVLYNCGYKKQTSSLRFFVAAMSASLRGGRFVTQGEEEEIIRLNGFQYVRYTFLSGNMYMLDPL